MMIINKVPMETLMIINKVPIETFLPGSEEGSKSGFGKAGDLSVHHTWRSLLGNKIDFSFS